MKPIGRTYLIKCEHKSEIKMENGIYVPTNFDVDEIEDIFYQGEVIAYSGRTGNANDTKNQKIYPHLHLAIKENKQYIDPEPYINGKVNSTGKDATKKVYSTKITNIKCH